jgi:hypothetical protein
MRESKEKISSKKKIGTLVYRVSGTTGLAGLVFAFTSNYLDLKNLIVYGLITAAVSAAAMFVTEDIKNAD